MYKQLKIDISTRTIIKLVAILALIVFLYFIADIIIAFFIAIVIAAAIDPFADYFKRKKIPRALSVILIYLVFLGLITLIIYLLIPAISKQVIELSNRMPFYFEQFFDTFKRFSEFSVKYKLVDNVDNMLGSTGQSLNSVVTSAFGAVVSFFSGFTVIIVILVLSFYLVVEEGAIKNFIKSVVPEEHQDYVSGLINRIQVKLGGWLRGQLTLSVVITIFSFIGLSLLGVEYALVLALLAGLFELIPVIGPIVAAVPALFIAFVESPILALFVLILYIVIQQIENHVLVPKVMQKAVGLSPIVIIIAMLIGARLAGILGIILAVPLATAISVFIKDFYDEEMKRRSPEIGKTEIEKIGK